VTAEPPAAPTPIERSISFEYDYECACTPSVTTRMPR